MEERIKEATEMLGGLEFIDVNEPTNFEKHIIKMNRIGTYIDFDSIYNVDDGYKKIKKLQTMVRDGANDILGRSVTIDELEKIMDAVGKAVLYSEITDFDNIKYVHTVLTNVRNEENELVVKSVPMENSEVVYKITLICGNKSVIISMDEIPSSHPYQIAYDIYRGCSKVTKYGGYSSALIEDVSDTLKHIDMARTGHNNLRDIFEVRDAVFVPFDIINVGIYTEGQRRVLPYIAGAIFTGGIKNAHGFAIKATEGSLVPTFLERRYNLSLYNNEGLFLELVKKYQDDSIDSILMNSIRTYADARFHFLNDTSKKMILDQFKNFEFHDDRKHDEAKDLIKLA